MAENKPSQSPSIPIQFQHFAVYINRIHYEKNSFHLISF